MANLPLVVEMGLMGYSEFARPRCRDRPHHAQSELVDVGDHPPTPVAQGRWNPRQKAVDLLAPALALLLDSTRSDPYLP